VFSIKMSPTEETHHFERKTHCSTFLDKAPFNIKLVTYKLRIWKYWSVSWKGKPYTTIYNICVIRGPIFLQKGKHQRMHVGKLQLENQNSWKQYYGVTLYTVRLVSAFMSVCMPVCSCAWMNCTCKSTAFKHCFRWCEDHGKI
jgi:hypothetical protein